MYLQMKMHMYTTIFYLLKALILKAFQGQKVCETFFAKFFKFYNLVPIKRLPAGKIIRKEKFYELWKFHSVDTTNRISKA